MGKFGKGLTLAFFLVSWWCHANDGLGGGLAGSETPDSFPLIARLDARDDGFKQFIADVETNRKRIFNRDRYRQDGKPESAIVIAASLTVYRYVPREGDDLFSLAARCNIPYSALASLNRLVHPTMLAAGKTLLLPSMPGIFVPKEPESDLERLLASSRPSSTEEDSCLLAIGETAGKGTAFYFFPGNEFNTTERAFFLNTGFRFPLRTYRLTSRFGMRNNPITGNLRFHQGLDLAAPLGTEVYAAGDGTVTEIGEDSIYGNYIIIKHGGDWASLYGHLQRVGISLRSAVRSGMLIGWVGSTGQSTGPHLHFELRQNGKARDPDKYLFLPGGR